MKALITDLSRVLLSPVDNSYQGGLNPLYEEVKNQSDFDFWQYFELNQELLDYYHKLSKSIPVHIFTSGYIQEFSELNKILKEKVTDIFSAVRLGVKKSEESAYLKLLKIISINPQEIVYIDDKEKNIKAAKKAGLNCILYRNNNQLINNLCKKQF